MELHEFEPTVAIGGLENGDLGADAIEAYHTVDPGPLGRVFDEHLEPEVNKELCHCREAVDHDSTLSRRWIVIRIS